MKRAVVSIKFFYDPESYNPGDDDGVSDKDMTDEEITQSVKSMFVEDIYQMVVKTDGSDLYEAAEVEFVEVDDA